MRENTEVVTYHLFMCDCRDSIPLTVRKQECIDTINANQHQPLTQAPVDGKR